MKKSRIFLIFILVIIAIIAGVVWWQFDNIRSAYYSFKYDNSSIGDMIDKQNDDVDKYLQSHGDFNVRQSTEPEQKLHGESLITDDEFVDILTGKTSVGEMFGTDVGLDDSKNFVDSSGEKLTNEDLQKAKDENSPVQTPQPTVDTSEKASECIARMYVLKSTFESKLNALYNEARQTSRAMTDEQKKNGKSEIIKSFYSRATALESECDAQVDAILAQLDAALTESGEDKSIIDKIRQSYSEEKRLKKAYYINLTKS